jgi:hypothetical protein
MKTPSGIECRYFFGDYYRGRSSEECRLINPSLSTIPWSVDLCKTCPVPDITRANACENMTLFATIKKGLLKSKHVVVTAYCSKSKSEVKVPQVGCELCHREIPNLEQAKE